MNYDGSPAGVFIRFFALLIDGILLGIIVFIFFPNEAGVTNLTQQFIQTCYAVILPILWTGYTIGKRLMGIRIVKIDGTDVGLGIMLVREVIGGILYAISFGILAIVSIFMVALREDKRSIHDLLAGTYVTYNKPNE